MSWIVPTRSGAWVAFLPRSKWGCSFFIELVILGLLARSSYEISDVIGGRTELRLEDCASSFCSGWSDKCGLRLKGDRYRV